MDMWEIILRIVDGSRLEEFKPSFGKGMITTFAYIHGKPFAGSDFSIDADMVQAI